MPCHSIFHNYSSTTSHIAGSQKFEMKFFNQLFLNFVQVIRKKLVRKTLDMIKKIADEKYNDTFWKEFGTNIKLGVIEDHSNRTRLAKLLRFQSSHHPSDITSLDQYVERMKEKQDKIYFMAGSSRKEVR